MIVLLHRNNDVNSCALDVIIVVRTEACTHEKIKNNKAIWCVLEYILIRFCLEIFPKITI